MINRGLVFKLYPEQQTELLFRQFAGVCRLVYNLALEQRNGWGQSHKIGYATQGRELTKLRKEFDFVGDVSVSCEQQTLRDLDKAFQSFFKGIAGYPKLRKRSTHSSFRFPGREIHVKPLNGKWSAVCLPKIGWVKFRRTRKLLGIIKNVTVSNGPLGWHVTFSVEIEHETPEPNTKAVGVDRGIAITAMLSDGTAYRMPGSLKDLDARHRRLQRFADRKTRGSRRWQRAMKNCARLQAEAARIRKHFNHVVTSEISNRYGVVVLERLRARNMMRSAKGTVESPGKNVKAKAGLNRSIANQAWYQFEFFLKYKTVEKGGRTDFVNPAYTSQTCPECGAVDRESRESQALFSCVHCGFEANADWTASVEILRRNTSKLRVEASVSPACEARSSMHAAMPLEIHVL